MTRESSRLPDPEPTGDPVAVPHPTLMAAALEDELARIGGAHLLCVEMGQGMEVVRNDAGKLIIVHPSADVPFGQVRDMSLRDWMGWA
jgi:hypothetical protein